MVARNYVNAIQEAKGKYIATLDGDDYWNTVDKLQRQVDILECIRKFLLYILVIGNLRVILKKYG